VIRQKHKTENAQTHANKPKVLCASDTSTLSSVTDECTVDERACTTLTRHAVVRANTESRTVRDATLSLRNTLPWVSITWVVSASTDVTLYASHKQAKHSTDRHELFLKQETCQLNLRPPPHTPHPEREMLTNTRAENKQMQKEERYTITNLFTESSPF
jgi:hypothetical protein